MGKLAPKELQELLGCIKKDSRVVVPPQVGYDAGVHLIDGKYLVVATDPCTGVPEEWFGYLLLNYAASDVSLSGAKPEFCTITLLGPRSTPPEKFYKIMKQVCGAANELGIAIVRGHTGTYDSISEMVGVCTTYGTIMPEKLITSGGAKANDYILCTKPVGLETAVNFSLKYKGQAQQLFGTKQAEELNKLVPMQSCVKEALQLAEVGGVHAMHDATEGGISAALSELATASQVGFQIEWEQIPFCPQVEDLKKNFGLSDEQLLAISSTGTVLAAVDPKDKGEAKKLLSRIGLEAYFIGAFTSNKKRILVKSGKKTLFPNETSDPYSKILSGDPNFKEAKVTS